jgi:hypothetical protein
MYAMTIELKEFRKRFVVFLVKGGAKGAVML